MTVYVSEYIYEHDLSNADMVYWSIYGPDCQVKGTTDSSLYYKLVYGDPCDPGYNSANGGDGSLVPSQSGSGDGSTAASQSGDGSGSNATDKSALGATTETRTTTTNFDHDYSIWGCGVRHVEVVTKTKSKGKVGKIIGAYAFTDKSLDDSGIIGSSGGEQYGVGINILGFGYEVSVEGIGAEEEFSDDMGGVSIQIDIHIDAYNETIASICIADDVRESYEIKDEYSIEGNTGQF